jgi:glycosyltransferase involved in cell wall biosynthesis
MATGVRGALESMVAMTTSHPHTTSRITDSSPPQVDGTSPLLPGLTVVLPCFNEEGNVADAIRSASAAASATSADYEVIVVDDGSGDSTARIAATFAESDRRVRLILHSGNRGYGAALRSGIGASRMPWILLTDADLQFDLGELADFVPYAESADLLVGWRILRQDPLNRRLNAAAWNWLVRRTFHLPVRDVDCAFKLMRTEVVQPLPLDSTGAMISTELLVKSLGAGARLRELGVHHRPRVAGEQSGANPRVVLRAFRELLGLRRVLRSGGLQPA